MAVPHDESMTDDVNKDEPRPVLSENEQRALEFYDKLQGLRLEIAIIKAQHSIQIDMTEEMTLKEATAAQHDLLETRAKYLLRNQVIDSVLSANPILKAVHNGTETSPVERDLLPYVHKRDEAAISVAKLASSTANVRTQTTETQSKMHGVTRKNVALAAEVMELVAQVKEKSGYLSDEKAQGGLQSLENGVRTSRQWWRVMKGITSGVVVGSSVDWARDEALRDLVLDPEDEG